MRFKRSIRRNRQGDALTLYGFIKKEKEENIDNIENQQLKTCIEMADIVIINNSTIEAFYRKIDEAIEKDKKTAT